MSEYSERSQQLAKVLREKAVRNLQAQRSAKTGRYVTKGASQGSTTTVSVRSTRS